MTRATRQQSAVLEALRDHDSFVSAQAIHAALRAAGDSVGLATVYRALQRMVTDGQADAVRAEDGKMAYRACSHGHHHHLVCRSCGTAIEIDGPQVETWAKAVAAEHGFTEVAHTVELFGVCAKCSART